MYWPFHGGAASFFYVRIRVCQNEEIRLQNIIKTPKFLRNADIYFLFVRRHIEIPFFHLLSCMYRVDAVETH